VEKLLRKLAAEAVGTKENPTAWPTALILSILAALVVILIGVSSMMAGRKRAAAAHKLARLENDERQKEDLWNKLDKSSTKRDYIEEGLRRTKAKITKTIKAINTLDESRAVFEKKLEAVTSWDDVA
jgi:septal ring factor EnvC (AmiA/AmiB activator)